MRTRIPRSALLLCILALLVANGFVAAQLFTGSSEGKLTVAFLDVGQGDAIYIETPDGLDLLIDGGKDRSVIRELPRVMGPLDRTLDVVVATHPDADHIGGLPDVLARYRVGTMLVSGKSADSSQVDRLADAAGKESGLVVARARQGMRLHLGSGAYADILYPEANANELRETNDASVVMRIVYGETEFLLTGDAPSWVEERLVKRYGTALRSDVLKAGHHGSRTSTSDLLLAATAPQTVVVSAGKDNSYGHPHEEVVRNVQETGAALVSTAEEGTMRFVSDGTAVRLTN